MKVLHISYAYDFNDGGISTVVEQLIREQKKTKIKVRNKMTPKIKKLS